MPDPDLILPKLKEHAQAIGYVCIHWAMLELDIDGLLTRLVPLEPGPVGETVTHSLDIRDKIQILIGLAYARTPNDDWFERAKSTLNHIDNELRTERNRMIHDVWLQEAFPTSVGRLTRIAKLKKPQARTFVLVTHEIEPISAEDINGLVVRILVARTALTQLISEYARQQKSSPEK